MNKYGELEKVKTTFLNGGYYTASITDRISVISINSIYYDEHKLNSPKKPY